MESRYRVVFLGLKKEDTLFKYGMSKIGVSPVVSDSLIKKAPVILKENMPKDVAQKYAEAVQNAGGNVAILQYQSSADQDSKENILRIEPMENFTMCPQCGYKQLKAGTCVKCGLVFK